MDDDGARCAVGGAGPSGRVGHQRFEHRHQRRDPGSRGDEQVGTWVARAQLEEALRAAEAEAGADRKRPQPRRERAAVHEADEEFEVTTRPCRRCRRVRPLDQPAIEHQAQREVLAGLERECADVRPEREPGDGPCQVGPGHQRRVRLRIEPGRPASGRPSGEWPTRADPLRSSPPSGGGACARPPREPPLGRGTRSRRSGRSGPTTAGAGRRGRSPDSGTHSRMSRSRCSRPGRCRTCGRPKGRP